MKKASQRPKQSDKYKSKLTCRINDNKVDWWQTIQRYVLVKFRSSIAWICGDGEASIAGYSSKERIRKSTRRFGWNGAS